MPAPIAVALTNRWAFASRLNGVSRGLHHAGRAVGTVDLRGPALCREEPPFGSEGA